MRAIARLWRGEMPLAEAFWTWAVIGGALVNVATSAATLILLSRDLPVLALIAGYAPSLPYNLLVTVGVWRSAESYTGARVWANSARIGMVAGMILLSVT